MTTTLTLTQSEKLAVIHAVQQMASTTRVAADDAEATGADHATTVRQMDTDLRAVLDRLLWPEGVEDIFAEFAG